MDIKEIKKLLNQEIKNYKLQEATNPGTPKAKIKAAQSAPAVDPDVTYVTSIPKDPAIPPPESKQPKPRGEIQNPEDFYRCLMRLYVSLENKFFFEMKDEEASSIIRETLEEEIRKLRDKYPHLDIGSKTIG